MGEQIQMNTATMDSVAASLERLVDQLQSVHIPSAADIGWGFFFKLNTQKKRLSGAVERTRTLSVKIRKASAVQAECEALLLTAARYLIETDRVTNGDVSGAIRSGTQSVDVLGNLVNGFLRGKLDKLYTDISQAMGIKKKVNGNTEGFSTTDCETQRKLALGIYSGFDNGDLARSLRAQGFATLTVNEPAGIVAYRMAEDGVPEIQMILKGTNPSDVTDIASDAAFSIDRDGYHSGFHLEADCFLKAISDEVIGGAYGGMTYGDVLAAASKGSPININITGHSLGAAESQIIAATLLKSGIPTTNVTAYTFASPTVATENASQASYLDGAQIYNIVNTEDAVPKLGAGGVASFANTGNLGTTYTFANGTGDLVKNHVQAYENISYNDLKANG